MGLYSAALDEVLHRSTACRHIMRWELDNLLVCSVTAKLNCCNKVNKELKLIKIKDKFSMCFQSDK